MELKNARVLITGGSEGIGRGIAEALLARGAKVAIMARDEKKLKHTAEEIGAVAVAGDVAEEEDAERAVANVIAEFGGLDILVNNAGIGYFAPLHELDKAQFERVFAVNVTGAMLMGRAAPIVGVLEIDDRGFVPEFSVFATNPF